MTRPFHRRRSLRRSTGSSPGRCRGATAAGALAIAKRSGARRAAVLVALLAAVAGAATADAATRTPTPTPRATPRVVSIALSPAAVTRLVGQERTFTAQATLSDGSTRNVTQLLVYKSSNSHVAKATNEVGNRSLVLAVGPGTAKISGRDPVTGVSSHDSHGDATMTVLEAPTVTPTPRPTKTDAGRPTRTRTPTPRPTPKIVSIALSPPTTTRLVGQSRTYTASATLSDGSTRNVTQQLEYESSDPGVAEATNQDGNRSLVLAVGPGTATISARDPASGISSSDSDGDATMTVTAVRTPTPTRTPRPTKTPGGGSTPRPTRTHGPTALPTPLGLSLADPTTAKAATDCQKAITTMGGKYLRARLRGLGKCAEQVFQCLQATTPGTTRDMCVVATGPSCARELDELADERAPLIAGVLERCGTDALGMADVLGSEGLGYESVEAACLAAGAPLLTVDDVGVCLLTQLDCRAERILEAFQPRAKELLGVAGVPPAVLDALACLPDHGGTGEGLADLDAGKALARCARTIKRAGTRVVSARLAGLEKCADAVFACLQTKPLDIACVTKRAQGKCTQGFTHIENASSRMALAIARACGDVDFTDALAADGAELGALADTCAGFDISDLATLNDYVRCLSRQLACVGEDALLFQSPRASELLRLVGYGFGAACPAPSPTPTPTATETPTETPTPTPEPSPTATVGG